MITRRLEIKLFREGFNKNCIIVWIIIEFNDLVLWKQRDAESGCFKLFETYILGVPDVEVWHFVIWNI